MERDKIRPRLLACVLGGLLLVAGPASAHTGTGLPGGFASGFLHPLSGFDHLLAMVAVGLWGAFLGRPLVIALPVIFPTVMAFGAAIGMSNILIPHTEIGIALSVLVLGAVIAFGLKAPIWAASLIVAAFAICHGYAHGRELPSAADPIGYAVGFMLATGLLHMAGIGLGLINDVKHGQIVTRGIGVGIAVSGAWFLYAALAA
jgi:urease accessory protein